MLVFRFVSFWFGFFGNEITNDTTGQSLEGSPESVKNGVDFRVSIARGVATGPLTDQLNLRVSCSGEKNKTLLGLILATLTNKL